MRHQGDVNRYDLYLRHKYSSEQRLPHQHNLLAKQHGFTGDMLSNYSCLVVQMYVVKIETDPGAKPVHTHML